MFVTLFIKELKTIVLTPRYWTYLALTVVLMCGSMLLLGADYARKAESHNLLAAEFREQYAAATKSICDPIVNGTPYAVAPWKLQFWSLGTATDGSLVSTIGNRTWETDWMPMVRTESTTNPLPGFFPGLDFPALITFFLSLMVLVFCYRTVAGEREDGTLKLMLSYPLPRSLVITAKLLGGYAAVMLPVLFGLVVCLLAVQLAPFLSLSGADTAAVMLITAAGALYLLVIYLLGTAVSVHCRRSQTAIAVLLLVWLILVVVVHSVTLMVVHSLERPVTVSDVVQAKAQNVVQEWNAFKEAGRQKFGEEALNTYKHRGYWQYTHLGLVTMHMRMKGAFQRTNIIRYLNNVEQRKRLLDMLGAVSPSLLFMGTAQTLAGTGIDAYISRGRQLVEFSAGYNETLAEHARDLERTQNGYWEKANDGSSLLARVTPFREAQPGLKSRLGSVMMQVTVLCMYAVLLFLVSYRGFIRKDFT